MTFRRSVLVLVLLGLTLGISGCCHRDAWAMRLTCKSFFPDHAHQSLLNKYPGAWLLAPLFLCIDLVILPVTGVRDLIVQPGSDDECGCGDDMKKAGK